MGFSMGIFGLENLLLWRQYGVLKRTTRPKALTAEIDQETFDKSQVYTSDTSFHFNTDHSMT